MSVRTIKLWDLPVRLTHWLLTLSVLGCFGTAEWGWLSMQWHFYFGYAVLVLSAFRVLWGIVGSQHARFRSFLRGPKAVINYLRGRGADAIGHNPIGGWSVLLMLGALLTQSISGLFNSDDIEWFGPLNERVSLSFARLMGTIHGRLYWLLALLIGVHIVAVLGYLLLKKTNLITPMLSGKKAHPSAADEKQKPLWQALVLLALCTLLLWAAIRFWPTPLNAATY
jgi:cytochrome b